tara:strand:+ start:87 stop:338 length:252 start_codon:yes stop_codon:yes gene_type:complete
MAQELLSTFEDDLRCVSLCPSDHSGIFQISINEVCIWDRKIQNGFPDIKQLKQLVRDHIAPDRSLGHADKKVTSRSDCSVDGC